MPSTCIPQKDPVGSGPVLAPEPSASSSGLRIGWEILAERENHLVSVRHGMLMCQVWRRRDLDITRGAELARLLADQLEDSFRRGVSARGFVFDLREAPPVSGPVTQGAISHILTSAERYGVRIAVVVGPGALQAMQIRRLTRECAPSCGVVMQDVESAEDWAWT